MKSHDLAKLLLAQPNMSVITSDEDDSMQEVLSVGKGQLGEIPDDPNSGDLDNPRPCIVLHIERNSSLGHFLVDNGR